MKQAKIRSRLNETRAEQNMIQFPYPSGDQWSRLSNSPGASLWQFIEEILARGEDNVRLVEEVWPLEGFLWLHCRIFSMTLSNKTPNMRQKRTENPQIKSFPHVWPLSLLWKSFHGLKRKCIESLISLRNPSSSPHLIEGNPAQETINPHCSQSQVVSNFLSRTFDKLIAATRPFKPENSLVDTWPAPQSITIQSFNLC